VGLIVRPRPKSLTAVVIVMDLHDGGSTDMMSPRCGGRRRQSVTHAPLAQLDRASVYGTEGYWFEPSGVYYLFIVRCLATFL
jgi:hypothetical protein